MKSGSRISYRHHATCHIHRIVVGHIRSSRSACPMLLRQKSEMVLLEKDRIPMIYLLRASLVTRKEASLSTMKRNIKVSV